MSRSPSASILALLLLAPLLGAAEDCGSGGDDPTFGGGSSSSGDDGGDDGGDDDGDDSGDSDAGGGGDSGDSDSGDSGTGDSGTGGDDAFSSVSVTCEGDMTEYTWTYRAELNIQASYVTVEVDPETASWEAWELAVQDDDGTIFEEQVTELLSSRDCDTPATLRWTAFGFGSWEETTESTYSP